MRFAVVRFVFERALVGCNGLIELSQLLQSDPEIIVRRGMSRRNLQRTVIAFRRLVKLAKLVQHATEVIVRIGMVRDHLDGSPVLCGGLLELTRSLQHVSEIEVNLRKVGLDVARVAVSGLSLVQPSRHLE